MTDKIGPYWSGFLNKDNCVELAQAIEEKFAGKSFSTLFNSEHSDRWYPKPDAAFDLHRKLDKIYPVLGNSMGPYIYIIARCQWSLHEVHFVCLTEKGIFVEKIWVNGYETWAWILED